MGRRARLPGQAAASNALRVCEKLLATDKSVIPAQAGIQFVGLTALKINQMHNLDSRLRGNDGSFGDRFGKIHRL